MPPPVRVRRYRGAARPATRGELATLWVDEPGAGFNVALVCRFAAGPFRRADGAVDADGICAEIAHRAARVPVLRRRVTIGRHPAWVEDDDFRPDRQVHRVELPDGTDLLDWCADRILEPLDRGAPLWRADVVPLPGGEFALLFVAHHVLADGRTGVAILRGLLDATSGGEPGGSGAPPAPPRPPVIAARRSRWQRIRDALGDLRGRAPSTSLSGPVGRRRRLAVLSAGLEPLRAAEATLGATVNDLLLAAVTAGLRTLLASRGDPVDELTLRASVPVSSGAAGQPDGMLLVPLPVGEPDPLRRLAAITATTARLKGRLRAGGGNVFDVLRLPTPLARAAVRGMRDIAARSINLFVTDVPGPAEPLALAGARLLSAVPVAPLSANVPLGVAALSYAGTLHVAINADAAVTDVGVLRDAMAREFAVLAGHESSRPAHPKVGHQEVG